MTGSTVRVTSRGVAVRRDGKSGMGELGALVRFWPDDARKRILSAYDHGGSATEAAAWLGISYRALTRYILTLGMGDEIDKAFPRSRGRPRAASAVKATTAPLQGAKAAGRHIPQVKALGRPGKAPVRSTSKR